MEIQSVFEIFTQSIFSVVVSAFLLLRMEKELRLLRNAIETLRHCPTCKVSPWNVTIEDEDKDEV